MDYFKLHYPKSVAVEVKVLGGKLADHQQAALNQVTKGLFAHKLKDMGNRQPFDFFILKDADAFVVICNGRKCQAHGLKDNTSFDFVL